MFARIVSAGLPQTPFRRSHAGISRDVTTLGNAPDWRMAHCSIAVVPLRNGQHGVEGIKLKGVSLWSFICSLLNDARDELALASCLTDLGI